MNLETYTSYAGAGRTLVHRNEKFTSKKLKICYKDLFLNDHNCRLLD